MILTKMEWEAYQNNPVRVKELQRLQALMQELIEAFFESISGNEELTTEQIGTLAIKTAGQIEGLEDIIVYEPELTEESE